MTLCLLKTPRSAYFSPAKTKPRVSRLLRGKRRRNFGEGGFELCAEAVNDRDYRDRDACGDEAIFNGGRPGLVLEKRTELAHQLSITGTSKVSVN